MGVYGTDPGQLRICTNSLSIILHVVIFPGQITHGPDSATGFSFAFHYLRCAKYRVSVCESSSRACMLGLRALLRRARFSARPWLVVRHAVGLDPNLTVKIATPRSTPSQPFTLAGLGQQRQIVPSLLSRSLMAPTPEMRQAHMLCTQEDP